MVNNLKNKNIYHLYVDPNEVDYSKIFQIKNYVRVYYLVRDGYKFLPMYEFSLLKNKFENEKVLNFCFYCSAKNKKRDFVIKNEEVINSIENSKINIDKIGKRTKPSDQIEYYELLSKSLFTLIIKSYNDRTFSIIRFFEAVENDCLPIVMYDCCLDELDKTYHQICDIIKKYLIVNDFNKIDKK